MSRFLLLSAACLAIGGVAASVQAQCGGSGHYYGGYWPTYSNYGHGYAYYGGPNLQRRCYPQTFYYQPRRVVPTYPSGNPYGGYSSPTYSPMYSAPQGSSSRGYDSAPSYQGQSTPQLAPMYSAPQGSGSR